MLFLQLLYNYRKNNFCRITQEGHLAKQSSSKGSRNRCPWEVCKVIISFCFMAASYNQSWGPSSCPSGNWQGETKWGQRPLGIGGAGGSQTIFREGFTGGLGYSAQPHPCKVYHLGWLEHYICYSTLCYNHLLIWGRSVGLHIPSLVRIGL